MYVVKRNGKSEEVKFDKVLQRVKKLSNGLNVEPAILTQKVIAGVYRGRGNIRQSNTYKDNFKNKKGL
jgi:hypothetical protein